MSSYDIRALIRQSINIFINLSAQMCWGNPEVIKGLQGNSELTNKHTETRITSSIQAHAIHNNGIATQIHMMTNLLKQRN